MRTEDIVIKVFTRSFMGYDIEEVDRFLDELIDEIERMEAEKQEMLIAMEYLLGKLENGKKLPEREMRKAIAGGTQGKRKGGTTERLKKSPPCAENQESAKRGSKPAARSISRGTGNGAAKPVRAPKVKRVAKGAPEEAPAVQKQETPPKQGDDWLDELLGSLSERDKQGYRPPKEHTPETETAEPARADTESKSGLQTEAPARPEPEMRREPEAQPQREPVFKPEPQVEAPVEPAKDTRREPEIQLQHEPAQTGVEPDSQAEAPVNPEQKAQTETAQWAAPETGTADKPETNAGTDETAPDGEAREQ
jgi:DivIVA domain-containing protein